jgi:hypothetical protein
MANRDECQDCGGRDHSRTASRREFLYVGLVGGLGLTLGNYLGLSKASAAEALSGAAGGGAASSAPAAESIIHIYLPGGMSAQESLDPKPLAPLENRGAFNAIKTKIPGAQVSELMPNTAAIADKIAIIRSLSHGEAAHERGTHNMFTGYRPSPAVQYPSFGSVVSHELGIRNDLPPYICIPSQPNPYAGSGYLSSAFGPFSLGAEPAGKNFSVRDLNLPQGVDAARFGRRQSMLDAVDDHFRSLEKSDALSSMDSFYQHAYSLISSKSAREAFNLSAEPDALMDAYGRNQAGMRMLLARRLAESGVRFVSMTYGGWDHHGKIAEGFRAQMPAFDKAFAALVQDLDNRKMLSKTLIMVSSEFGRSPKIDPEAEGRGHWPRCFSVILAGGGIKGGIVYGSSDPVGAEPVDNPLSVEDFAATVYNRIGIDSNKELVSPGGRPIDIIRGGKVVDDLLV